MDRRSALSWGQPMVRVPSALLVVALIVVAIVVGATGSASAFWDSTIGTSGKITVATGTLSAKADHQVAVDGSYIHVVWASGTTVYYKRSSDGGHTWTTPAGWTNRTTISGAAPAVSAANGYVLVAYVGGSSPYNLYTVSSTDNGANWGGQTSRAAGNTGIGGAGTIDTTFADGVLVSTGASTGKGLLVYRTSGPGIGGTAGTFVLPLTLSGTTLTVGSAVNAVSGSAAGSPKIAASSTNAFLMWVPSSGNAAMYRSTNAGWTTWGVTAAPPGLTGAQGIAAQDGMAYEAYTNAGGTYVAAYNNTSNTWGSGVLAVTGASPSEAAISVDGTRMQAVAAYPSGSGIAPRSRMSTDGGSNWRLQKSLPTAAGVTYTMNSASASGSDSVVYSDGTSLFYSGWLVDVTAPSVPVVTALPLSTSSISLSWPASTDDSPSSDNIYYSVYTSGGSLVTTTTATGITVSNLDPDMSYGYYATATDDDGNTSADSTTQWATTDALRTDPTITPGSANGQAGWYSSEPTVSLSFNAAGTTYYSWDDTISPVAYSGTFTAIQGSHTLYYRSVDTSGHSEPWSSVQFKVDTVAPSAATLTSSAVGTSTAELSWSGATDGGSGIVGYLVYDVDTSSLVASTTGTTASLTGLAPATTYHYVVRTVDEAGNVSADSNTLTVTTDALDTTPPTTLSSVEPSAADGTNGWYRTAPVVSLLSDEPGTTHYALDGGASLVYSGPVIISEGQGKQIGFRSIDTAGNSETTQTLTFDVDVSAPGAVTLAGSPTGPTTAELSWGEATDAVSGVSGYRVYDADTSDLITTTSGTSASLTGLDPGTTYHYLVRTVDVAGNVSADSNMLTVTTEELDTTPPTTTRSAAPASADGSNGWYVTAPVVTLSASEPGTTYYAIDGGTSSVYGSPVTMAQGTHTITYRSVDLASNGETTQSATFKVDTSAPTAATLSGSATGQTTASLSWSGATDAVSGIAGYKVYDADTSAQVASTTASSASLTGLTAGTTYHYVVRTIDEAGRVSADSNTVTVTTTAADTTAPTTSRSVSPASPDGSNGWYITAPSVSLSANEAGTTYYAIDSAAASTYSSPVTIAQGIHEFAYYSIDLASNRETTRTTTIKVDTSSPSAPTLTGSSTGTSTASLSWSGAADAVSGIASYRIYDADTGNQVTSTTGTSASLTGLAPGTTRSFYVRTVDAAGRVSGNSNTVTVTLDQAGNVTPGTAEVTADNVWFRFTSVTTTGSASASAYSPQRAAPTNFRFIGGSYYDIHVTPGIFSGPVRVVVPYNPADVQGDPNDLRLFHWTGSEWDDVTVEGSVDTDAHTIEGETTSFSDFGVSEPLASSSSTTPASSTWSLALIGILAMGALALRVMREEREA